MVEGRKTVKTLKKTIRDCLDRNKYENFKNIQNYYLVKSIKSPLYLDSGTK